MMYPSLLTLFCMVAVFTAEAAPGAGSFRVVGSTRSADATLQDYTLCPSPDGSGEMMILNFRRDQFFLAVDLESGVCRQHSLAPGQAWALTTGKDGKVYLGTSLSPGALLLRYDPALDKVERLAEAPGEIILAWLETASDGTIYGGAYPSTSLFRYKGGELENLGVMAPGQTHNMYGAIGRNGKVYSGIGMKEETLIEYDIKTGAKRNIWPDSWRTTHAARVYLGEDGLVYAYPGIETETSKGKGLKVNVDGGVEVIPRNTMALQMMGCNPKSKQARPRLADGSVIAEVTRERVVIEPAGGGEPRVIELRYDGAVKPVFGLGIGPDGKVYGSSKPAVMFSYDPESDCFVDLLPVSPSKADQVYRKVASQGKVYMGSYTHAMFHVYDPARPELKARTIGTIGASQDRPVDMVAGSDGTIYIASYPGYGLLEGALTYFDPKQERFENFVSVIPGHSLNALALDEKGRRVYVGTTKYRGNGTEALETDAVVGEWDIEGRRLLRSVQPVPGEKIISALVVLPDGMICGLTSGGHWFGIDRERFEVQFRRDLGGPAASIARVIYRGQDKAIYGMAGRALWRARSEAPAEVEIVGRYGKGRENVGYGVEQDWQGRIYFTDGGDVVQWVP